MHSFLFTKPLSFWFLFCLHLHEFHAFSLMSSLNKSQAVTVLNTPVLWGTHWCRLYEVRRYKQCGRSTGICLTGISRDDLYHLLQWSRDLPHNGENLWVETSVQKSWIIGTKHKYCEKRTSLQKSKSFLSHPPLFFLLVLFWWKRGTIKGSVVSSSQI